MSELHAVQVGSPAAIARWHLVHLGPDKVSITIHSLPPSPDGEKPHVRDFDTLPEPHLWAIAFRRARAGTIVFAQTPLEGGAPVPTETDPARARAHDDADWEALHAVLYQLAAQRWNRWSRWYRDACARFSAEIVH